MMMLARQAATAMATTPALQVHLILECWGRCCPSYVTPQGSASAVAAAWPVAAATAVVLVWGSGQAAGCHVAALMAVIVALVPAVVLLLLLVAVLQGLAAVRTQQVLLV